MSMQAVVNALEMYSLQPDSENVVDLLKKTLLEYFGFTPELEKDWKELVYQGKCLGILFLNTKYDFDVDYASTAHGTKQTLRKLSLLDDENVNNCTYLYGVMATCTCMARSAVDFLGKQIERMKGKKYSDHVGHLDLTTWCKATSTITVVSFDGCKNKADLMDIDNWAWVAIEKWNRNGKPKHHPMLEFPRFLKNRPSRFDINFLKSLCKEYREEFTEQAEAELVQAYNCKVSPIGKEPWKTLWEVSKEGYTMAYNFKPAMIMYLNAATRNHDETEDDETEDEASSKLIIDDSDPGGTLSDDTASREEISGNSSDDSFIEKRTKDQKKLKKQQTKQQQKI